MMMKEFKVNILDSIIESFDRDSLEKVYYYAIIYSIEPLNFIGVYAMVYVASKKDGRVWVEQQLAHEFSFKNAFDSYFIYEINEMIGRNKKDGYLFVPDLLVLLSKYMPREAQKFLQNVRHKAFQHFLELKPQYKKYTNKWKYEY